MKRREAKAAGAKYYDGGRLCPLRHFPVVRRTTTGTCLECERVKNRESYATPEGRDMHINASRKWKERNQERLAQYVAETKPQKAASMAAYRATRKPELIAKKREWRMQNRDKDRAQAERYRNAHKEEVRRRFAAWAEKKGKIFFRIKVNARRAKVVGNGGTHTKEDIQTILRAQHGKCAYCRRNMRDRFTVDHIIPIASGGSNDPRNLQLLCKPCNSSKGAKHPLDFAKTLGLLV